MLIRDPNSLEKPSPMSVATKPGYRVDTSTPFWRTSAQSPDAKPVRPLFAAAYLAHRQTVRVLRSTRQVHG